MLTASHEDRGPAPASGQRDLLSDHIGQAPVSKRGCPGRSQGDVNFERTPPKPSRGAERAGRGGTCRGPRLSTPQFRRRAGGGGQARDLRKKCVRSPAPNSEGRAAGGGRRSAPPTSGSVGPAECRSDHMNHRPRRLFPHGHGCRLVSLSQPDGCHRAEPMRFRNLGEEGISRGDQAHGPAGACIPCPRGSSECPENSLPSGHQ